MFHEGTFSASFVVMVRRCKCGISVLAHKSMHLGNKSGFLILPTPNVNVRQPSRNSKDCHKLLPASTLIIFYCVRICILLESVQRII